MVFELGQKLIGKFFVVVLDDLLLFSVHHNFNMLEMVLNLGHRVQDLLRHVFLFLLGLLQLEFDVFDSGLNCQFL